MNDEKKTEALLENQPKNTSENTPENASVNSDPVPGNDNEQIVLENEAYRRHMEALNAEILEIRNRFGVTDTPVDSVAVLSGEVSELKSGFSELKEILHKIEGQQNAPAASVPQQTQQAWFPQMVQQPMMQPAPMFNSPALPYIQTPSYAPIMPAIPQFNPGGNR